MRDNLKSTLNRLSAWPHIKNIMTKIRFVDKISKDIEKRMRDGFVKYETSHGIDVNYKRFSLLLNNDSNETIGVLNAYTAFAEVYIDDLWVDSAHQRKGYGKMLIETLYNQYNGKGFNNINLITSQFQAPEFYKKCGFKVEFIRENIKNPKLTKYFFIKHFGDEVQTQGTVKKT